MKVSEKYSGKYLKAEHLQGREVRVQIAHLDEDVEMGEKKEKKDVIFFVGETKGLVLNRTNAETLAQALGDDSEGWHGASAVLYAVKTPTGDGIRIRVQSRPAKQNKSYNEADPPPIAAEELNSIPY